MNELARTEPLPYDPARFEPIGKMLVIADHAFTAQEPTKHRGMYIQHWIAPTCSRSIYKIATSWFVSDDGDLQTRSVYRDINHAGETAARLHQHDLRRAYRLLETYGLPAGAKFPPGA